MATKYIFVTGGVVSGLGKGITAASLGRLLKTRGLKVASQKLDPYINVDPGTMSPLQHGEVFVTDDGTETDIDLGHYERFTDENLNKYSNLTTGKVYWNVLHKERQGAYLGQTVQIIPHITNEIKSYIYNLAKSTEADVVITEIGGTTGDIESQPFLEAIRQVGLEQGLENCCYIHVVLVPYISGSNEYKSKPAQHSCKELQGMGIIPNVIVLRADGPVGSDIKRKISMFCNVRPDCVIENLTMPSLYECPLMLEAAGLTGDALDAAVDKALASGNVGEQVAGMADMLQAASPLDAYRANADPASDGMLADMGRGVLNWGADKVRPLAEPVWRGIQHRSPQTAAMIGAAARMTPRAIGGFVRDKAAPAVANAASGAARTLAAHPKLATAAMIGTGLALPMTTPLMMAGLGGTLAAHTALNANGLANRGYHAVADGVASSRASAVARTAGVEKGAPALATAHDAIADRYAASPFASREYRERVEARHAERARDRVYDDQAVNGMATSGMQARIDELLYQGLPGEQAPAARYVEKHPDSALARDMRAGDEMYRQFVEQGGQETDGAMRDAHHALDHGGMPAPEGPVPPHGLTGADTERLNRIGDESREMRQGRAHAAFAMWRQTPEGAEYLQSHPDAKTIPGTTIDGDAHRNGA